MMKATPSGLKRLFRSLRDSGKLKNFLVFLVFVCIAGIFWLIMALNDDIQKTYDIKLQIDNVPDSVTFITVPPSKLLVTVRDRGTNHVRYKITGKPELHIDFEDYASGNRFRVSYSSLITAMRHIFGGSAVVSSVVPDSLNLLFTRFPGKRVPIELRYEASGAPGLVLSTPKMSVSSAVVYSTNKVDTIRKLVTEKVVLGSLEKTTSVDVALVPVPGVRVEPSMIEVTFAVEPLVRKEADINVGAENVPLGQDILFFPSRIRVAYYVPMSRYNEETVPVTVQASFNEAVKASSDKVGVKVVSKAPYVSNVELLTDSVEYSLVRAN